MGRRRPSAASTSPASPLDDDDLLEEILLRLPPRPSSLPRSSHVCKRWRRVLSDPNFLRRFRRRHRTPPLLGFFSAFELTHPRFISTMGRPDRIPASRFSEPCRSPSEHWQFFGCRHGLAVFMDNLRREAVLWDPLTGRQRRVPSPSGFNEKRVFFISAAAMCAATEDGHVHGDCSLSPFKLVLVCTDGAHASACLYESQSGVWGNIMSIATTDLMDMYRTAVLIGSALHWSLRGADILQFDSQRQSFRLIEKPLDAHFDRLSFQILRTEDNCLGLAVYSELGIHLWERKSYCDVSEWALQKTIQLNKLFPLRMRADHKKARMMGYDEDTNAIFLSTSVADFMLQLEPVNFRNLAKRVCVDSKIFYPYRNFYVVQEGYAAV